MGETTSQRNFRVSISPTIGTVASFSGGDVTIGTGKAWNGGATSPDVVIGRRDISDITVGRPFDPYRDIPIWKYLLGALRLRQFTITYQALDQQGIRRGKPITFSKCRIKQISLPQYNEDTDADPARFEIQFTPGNVT